MLSGDREVSGEVTITVDTAMQEQIRNSDSQKFIDVQRFIDYKESGSLISTEIVGEEIFHLLISYLGMMLKSFNFYLLIFSIFFIILLFFLTLLE